MVERLPPGQRWVEKPIVYDIARVPPLTRESFTLRVDGRVERPLVLSWAEFLALPQAEVVADFHCVTRWSVAAMRWEGVLARTLLGLCRPQPDARWVVAHGREGYTTNVPYAHFAAENTILAHRLNGEPLPAEHGWPVRLVVPSLYAWKSAKYLARLEFTAENRRGFWEERGYHDVGDPWREERYSGR